MKQKQDPVTVLNDLTQAKLATTSFECGEDDHHFLRVVLALQLANFSLQELRCNLATYESLNRIATIGFIEPMNLLDASVIINGVDMLKPTMLDKGAELLEYLQRKNKIAIKWNEIVTPIKTSLMREVEAKQSRGIDIITPNSNLKIIK
jgi:hypothetical protein